MIRFIVFSLLGVLLLLGIAIAIGSEADYPVEVLRERYTTPASRFITIENMPVHYRDEGRGFPLLLLHGTASSLHTWDGWAEVMKDHLRVIRMDLPAFGLTGPHPRQDYRLSTYAAFVRQFMDTLGIDSCYIAGNSLGGAIAWKVAASCPGRVTKLILIDPAGFSTGKSASLAFRIARTPLLNKLTRYFTPRSLFRKSLEEVYGDPALVTDSLVDRYFELTLREGNRQAFIDRANTPSEGRPQLEDVEVPALIVWGARDRWIPVAHADSFLQQMPQAEIKIYDQLGHVPMEEAPKITARHALGFLQADSVQEETPAVSY